MEEKRPGTGMDQAAEWNLAAVQRLLWQRRWLVIAIAAEVFLLTGLVTFLRTPLYEASARVLIERATPKVLNTEDVVPTVWNEFEIQRFYQTQYLLIKDPAILRRALDYHGVREELLASLADDGDPDREPPADEALARWLRERIKVEQLEYSNVVKVSFRHPSPEVAADVVNAVIEAYRDFFVEAGVGARKGASDFLSRAIEEAQAEVLDLEKKLARVRKELRTVLPASGAEMGKTRLEKLDAMLTDAKAKRARARAKLRAYESAEPLSIPEVRDNPQILKYREDLAEMRRQLAELEGRVGPGWPRLRELQAAIRETEENMNREIRSLYREALQSARADLNLAEENVSHLQGLLDREVQRTADMQQRAGTFEKLRQEYQQKKAVLDRLLARREEVALSADLQDVLQRQVKIVDHARPPAQPAVPRVKLNLALGLAFGLFLGVAAAFLAEALDNKIRGPQQLADLSGLPLLGSIPRVEVARPRLVFSSRRKSTTTPVMAARNHDAEEAFRAIRSALLLSQPGDPPRVLLVGSALPGEGKSTISANLARTLAAFGQRVVLIDCDLRHPRLHRVFKAPKDRGITNVIAGTLDLGDVVFPTPYPHLSLVPGGPCPPDPATLLHPDRIREIFGRLRGEHGFDFVVVDTPPILVFADAFNLVPAVDGVILVARALQTPKDAVRQARELLAKVQARMLGCILNGEVAEERSGSYYRYYHYRKGYYRKAEERRRQAVRDRAAAPGAGRDAERRAGGA